MNVLPKAIVLCTAVTAVWAVLLLQILGHAPSP